MSKIIFLTLGFSLKVKENIYIYIFLVEDSVSFLLEGADFTTRIFSSSSSSFFCLERNPLLAILLLVGGNSVLTGGNRARTAVHVSH